MKTDVFTNLGLGSGLVSSPFYTDMSLHNSDYIFGSLVSTLLRGFLDFYGFANWTVKRFFCSKRYIIKRSSHKLTNICKVSCMSKKRTNKK